MRRVLVCGIRSVHRELGDQLSDYPDRGQPAPGTAPGESVIQPESNPGHNCGPTRQSRVSRDRVLSAPRRGQCYRAIPQTVANQPRATAPSIAIIIIIIIIIILPVTFVPLQLTETSSHHQTHPGGTRLNYTRKQPLCPTRAPLDRPSFARKDRASLSGKMAHSLREEGRCPRKTVHLVREEPSPVLSNTPKHTLTGTHDNETFTVCLWIRRRHRHGQRLRVRSPGSAEARDRGDRESGGTPGQGQGQGGDRESGGTPGSDCAVRGPLRSGTGRTGSLEGRRGSDRAVRGPLRPGTGSLEGRRVRDRDRGWTGSLEGRRAQTAQSGVR